MSTTWGQLHGSTGTLAIDLRLMDDPDNVASVDADESASWGSVTIWANGRNLFAHEESGEIVSSLHWYLLPLAEWLVANWDDLFHEERLPRAGVVDAASGIAGLVGRRLADESEEDGLDGEIRSWWARHNLSVGVTGSVLPPFFQRRWGDQVEFSSSARVPDIVPSHVVFTPVLERVSAADAAAAWASALHGLGHELVRRAPGSTRMASLRSQLDALADPARHDARVRILAAGHGVASEAAPAELLVAEAPPLALLFGSASPTLGAADVKKLAGLAVLLSGRADLIGVDELGDSRGLPPGPAGSLLGDAAWEALGDPDEVPVDVARILKDRGVAQAELALDDPEIRSVCLVSGAAACVAVNRSFSHGDAAGVRRFSLAHELCHLLIDRDRAVSLAVASGPWAPLDLERRANAFAAAFLMPSELVGAAVRASAHAETRLLAQSIADLFEVPLSSAIDRLRNLEVLTHWEADRLRGNDT